MNMGGILRCIQDKTANTDIFANITKPHQICTIPLVPSTSLCRRWKSNKPRQL